MKGQVTIDMGAVRGNVESLQAICPIMPMLKANGYGTCATTMARHLAKMGVERFGLAFVQEAIALREAGIKQDLFVMYASPEETGLAAQWDLEIGLSDLEMLRALEREKKPLRVHLKVDTGMNRLGCRPEEAKGLANAVRASKTVELVGLMSHLANAMDAESAQRQSQLFEQIAGEVGPVPYHHLFNSAAMLRWKSPVCNLARPGIALYRNALSLTTQIAMIRYCKVGETISYGGTHTCKADSKIAVIPLGYYDGIDRRFSNKGFVIISGQKAPIVGTICMDFFMCDVTHIPAATVGERVTLFGSEQSLEAFASYAGITVHEILSRLGPRLKRAFLLPSSHGGNAWKQKLRTSGDSPVTTSAIS